MAGKVVLYGATGYTGRLIARELDARGAAFAVAGRDAAKLAALSDALPSHPPTLVADLDDPNALERVASHGDALLSAAGPFRTAGPPLLRAALARGVHFGDITGEQSFLRWAHERDAEARDAEIAVVNALGFDVVPSDLVAARACRGLSRPSLDIAIASRARPSGGTRRSMAASAGDGWWYDHGTFRPGPVGRFGRAFEFPDPLGRMRGVFVPWGDVVTAPRSTNARVVRTYFTFPPGRAFTLRASWPLTHLLAKSETVRRRLAAEASRAPDGPSSESRARARFAILAEARDESGAVRRAIATGRDPYGLTGASAAEAAMRLAAGEVKARGTLTPSQAFPEEVFQTALAPFGFEIRDLPA